MFKKSIYGLYYRLVCDIIGRIYNSVAGGIIVQLPLPLPRQLVSIFICQTDDTGC
jgi:hypothetical protein